MRRSTVLVLALLTIVPSAAAWSYTAISGAGTCAAAGFDEPQDVHAGSRDCDDGDASFAHAHAESADGTPVDAAAERYVAGGDLDRDGEIDVVASSVDEAGVGDLDGDGAEERAGAGASAFEGRAGAAAWTPINFAAVGGGDVDGDGVPDAVHAGASVERKLLDEGRAGGDCAVDAASPSCSLAGDDDGDGAPENAASLGKGVNVTSSDEKGRRTPFFHRVGGATCCDDDGDGTPGGASAGAAARHATCDARACTHDGAEAGAFVTGLECAGCTSAGGAAGAGAGGNGLRVGPSGEPVPVLDRVVKFDRPTVQCWCPDR